jgi:hypothetical protein
MKTTTTIALAALAIATTSAARADTLRTCRGPLEVWVGDFNRPHRDVGRCYADDAASAAIIDAACEKDKPCVVRARVVPRDTPALMPRNYNVVRVLSARPAR